MECIYARHLYKLMTDTVAKTPDMETYDALQVFCSFRHIGPIVSIEPSKARLVLAL